MSARRILESFEHWRAEHQPLVLVTVVETEGSTYTKPGHRILIDGTGQYQGLVSGGCLEGDLAEHARTVLDSGEAQLLTYDLRDDGAEVFGLGIGCNGLFRVLLQALSPDSGYAPFSDLAESLSADTPAMSATVISSEDPALAPGATLIARANREHAWLLPDTWRSALARGCRERQDARQATCVTQRLDGRSARVLYAALRPLPRLLVLGAGLDAVPLVDMARRLGWRITVADHRPAYLARGDLAAADELQQVLPAELGRSIDLVPYTAAVVMSHHLDSDRHYLRALSRSTLAYIGLLGPAARRDRLLGELGSAGDALRGRLRAPVGLAIGADSPESIALAVLAEIHATLAGRVDMLAAGR